MEPLTFSHEIGIVAGIFLVVAYGLMNFGVLSTNSPLYQALNILGALGFGYTAFAPFNPGLLITEVVWAVVAVWFLWRIFIRKNTASTEVADAGVADTETSATDVAATDIAATEAADAEPALESAPAK